MKAAVYERMGAARDVLSVRKVEAPEPGPGQVRVRISLSAVNPSDWKARAGQTPRPIDSFQVPHMDGVGHIDRVGPGIDESRVGQRVWLWMSALSTRWGTAAEFSVVNAEQAVPLPETASDELGACLGIPALTAASALFSDGPLHGTDVLVAGGAGAVGHFAIELANWAGARTVTTVSTAEKAELATQAGADLVVNYRDDDVVAAIKDFSAGIGRVIEVSLVDNWELDVAVCVPGAHVVTYAFDDRELTMPLRPLIRGCINLNFLLIYTLPRPAALAAVRSVADAVAANALTPLPIHRFSLDQIAEAQDAVEAGVTGKVVVDVND